MLSKKDHHVFTLWPQISLAYYNHSYTSGGLVLSKNGLLLEEKHEICGQLLPLNSMPHSYFPVPLNAPGVSYNCQAYLHKKQNLRIMAKTFNHKYLQIPMLLLHILFNFVSDFQLYAKIFPSPVLQLIRKQLRGNL